MFECLFEMCGSFILFFLRTIPLADSCVQKRPSTNCIVLFLVGFPSPQFVCVRSASLKRSRRLLTSILNV